MTEQINIQDFLQENVEPAHDTAKVHFDRFKSPWVIKTITQQDNDNLRKQATKTRIGKGGRKVTDLDTNAYTDSLIVNCVKVPDLYNAELQKSYGTEGDAASTAKKMLKIGEYADLEEEILKLNGFDDEEELKEDVKN